jgi:hypothetical protein
MTQPFNQWRDSLDKEFGLSERETLMFRAIVETEYEMRFEEAVDYFCDKPDWLCQECQEHLIELWELEKFFCEKEDYEKCAVLRDIQIDLKREYTPFLEIEILPEEILTAINN